MTANVADLLSQTRHRPWPLPTSPWLMIQTWKRLLFAHWPVDSHEVQRWLPPGLTLDTYEGQAWIAVVPFEMDFRVRYTPWTVRFGELNVRTYVIADGKPGVYFSSLDASDPMTVYLARRIYSLPYYRADITLEAQASGAIDYTCQRLGKPDRRKQSPAYIRKNACFQGSYRPISPVYKAAENTLEHWLTERYCLYASDPKGRLYRGNIHHTPWPLQRAEANFETNTMALAGGIHLPDSAPILHYVEHIDVLVWPLEAVNTCQSR
jgi:uncharacterized protein